MKPLSETELEIELCRLHLAVRHPGYTATPLDAQAKAETGARFSAVSAALLAQTPAAMKPVVEARLQAIIDESDALAALRVVDAPLDR